jgi:hypothetical protein
MEWNFQRIILTLAIIVLLIVLVSTGVSLYKGKFAPTTWPPIVGKCPDYWIDLSGNGSACYNEKSLGTCNLPSETDQNTMNFNVTPYNTTEGNCAKYTWAKNCKVSWDGITYGNSNPCVRNTNI